MAAQVMLKYPVKKDLTIIGEQPPAPTPSAGRTRAITQRDLLLYYGSKKVLPQDESEAPEPPTPPLPIPPPPPASGLSPHRAAKPNPDLEKGQQAGPLTAAALV